MTGKLWFKIGEAAHRLGASPKELRYWESVIPEIRPRRSKGNLRYYHLEELPRLERIRNWLSEGLTVADCQQLLLTGQLKRSLGLEVQALAPVPTVPTPPKAEIPPQASPRIEQAREALASLLERLQSSPRPAPGKRRRGEPKVPAAALAPPPPSTPAPKPSRSRKKPPPEPGDPENFGPLFDQA